MSGRPTLRRRKPPPTVLIVDDNDDDARAAATILGKKVKAICRLPSDVLDQDLAAASLVLVDFRIDDWPERDRLATPSLKPKNGLALVATLRSNLSLAVSRSPTAFALRSGKLDDVSGSYAHVGREHVLAKLYDLEWVFSKAADAETFSRQVTCVAEAVRRIPHPWPSIERRRLALSRFFGLSSAGGWMHAANEDLDRAFPPEDILSETSRGLAVVRWLLHEIFPYPGPLLDVRYLAARLFVDPARFAVATASRQSGLRRALSPFEYKGALAGFTGPRWWRAGIEHWLWNKTKGRQLDKDAIVGSLKSLVADEVFTALVQPVVSIDEHFRPTDILIELKDAVQLRPDDWPQAADAAWALEADVANDATFMARVDPRDRERVQKFGSA